MYFSYRELCEKVKGQRVRGSKEERLGTYNIRENRKTAADEEICRPSAFAARTRKLSSCADGSWGFPPARVGRRWAPRSRYRVIGGGYFFYSKKKTEGNIYFIYREVCEKVERQKVRRSKKRVSERIAYVRTE